MVVAAVSVLGGVADSLLSGRPGLCLGLAFTAGCVAAGLWVRPTDLSSAPVSAPIAFTLALLVTGDGGGPAGHTMSLLTGLATETGWLYTGTLCAAAIVAVRKVAAARRERRRQGPGG